MAFYGIGDDEGYNDSLDLTQMKCLLIMIENYFDYPHLPAFKDVIKYCQQYRCNITQLKVALELLIFQLESQANYQDVAPSNVIYTTSSANVTPSKTVNKCGTINRALGSKKPFCKLCKSNNETVKWYTNHNLKDQNGKVTCPILRNYKCSLCGATGDDAHTIKYCHLPQLLIKNKAPINFSH